MENNLLRDNYFKIVGRLVNADVTIGNRKQDGAHFVSVKATTEEKLGFTGAKEGISAHCVCLVEHKDKIKFI